MKRFNALAAPAALVSFLVLALGIAPVVAADEGADPLQRALDAQPAQAQERYGDRHPAETLAFFGIEPGMTVVEVLPGGGWYSQILVPYLGPQGTLVGANYPQSIWPRFGFFDDAFITQMQTWVTDWPAGAAEWTEDGAAVAAFELGELPVSMGESADAVLFIRALHNLVRFDAEGGYLGDALADTLAVLKPGGTVGVVQHEARPDKSDDYASGANGYLKKAFVIEAFENAGFEFVAESDINENPLDQPGDGDVVWRLPPTYAGAEDDSKMRATMQSIGESNRMTLKFRKPASAGD